MTTVAVLMGGTSRERDISLVSGRACAKGLRDAGFNVVEIEVDRHIANRLLDFGPDVCFNALHGPMGEDGSIQGLLNVIGIPYTHSGVAASALAMDKFRTKLVASQCGIPVPAGRRIGRDEFWACRQPDPFVIKPINDGSSINTFVVRDPARLPFEEKDWPFEKDALLEELVEGAELTVTVLDDRPLTVTQILTDKPFYDFSAKYGPGGSAHVIPARISPRSLDLCLQYAIDLHRELGCRGISRSDFILARTSVQPVLLEINTQPGMTPTSLAPEQAAFVGIGFSHLMRTLIVAAATD